MECIEIKVGKETAEKWSKASPETKGRIGRRIELELANDFLQENKEKLIKSMERLARTAKENGLTEEILQEILSDDD